MSERFIRKSRLANGQIQQSVSTPPTPAPRVKAAVGLTWKGVVLVVAGLIYNAVLILIGVPPEQATKTTAWTIGLLLAVVVSGPPMIALAQEISRRIGTPRQEQGAQ